MTAVSDPVPTAGTSASLDYTLFSELLQAKHRFTVPSSFLKISFFVNNSFCFPSGGKNVPLSMKSAREEGPEI